MSSRVTDSSSATGSTAGKLKKTKKLGKFTPDKQTRKAEARAELAQARKEKQRAKAPPKSKSTTQSKNTTEDAVIGYCDICQMTERFQKKHMVLWKCKDCGVLVHDECYGASEKHKGRPYPNFRCFACQAVGHSYRVREKDPFSGEHLAVKQEKRPTECCLCSVEDGIHAMHPLYDAHGKKGRQILLPDKPRRLAWVHTLCALTVNMNKENGNMMFGCADDGWYDDDDDEASLLEDADVNSDLDIDVEGASTGVHHFVYWGYLHMCMGVPFDDWSKGMVLAKEQLRCQVCGKDDKTKITLPGGQEVFRSLRIPVQCTANDHDENENFKDLHNDTDLCFMAFHVGCAMWGRFDGQYYRQRRCWYLPGLEGEGIAETRVNPTVEVYCPHHATDLFGKALSSDMTDRLPGPFVPIQGEAWDRYLEKKGETETERGRGAHLADRNARPKLSSASSKLPGAAAVAAAVAARQTSQNYAQKPVARKESRTKNSRAKLKKGGAASKKKGDGKPAAAAMQNLSLLHGEKIKKKPKFMKLVDNAVQVQTGKHGRLVKQKRSASSSSGEKTQKRSQKENVELSQAHEIQQILDAIVERRQECIDNSRLFNKNEFSMLRVQLLKKYEMKEDFGKLWKSAKKFFEEGRYDILAEHGEGGDQGTDDDDGVVLEDVNGVEPQSSEEKQDQLPETQVEPLTLQKDASGRESENPEPEQKGVEMEDAHDKPASAKTDDESNSELIHDKPASAKTDDESNSELIHAMAKDILEAFEANGVGADNKDPTLITRILKDKKKAWKKKSGLSKADYKVFSKKAHENVEGKCGQWLSITSKSKTEIGAVTDEQHTEQGTSTGKEGEAHTEQGTLPGKEGEAHENETKVDSKNTGDAAQGGDEEVIDVEAGDVKHDSEGDGSDEVEDLEKNGGIGVSRDEAEDVEMMDAVDLSKNDGDVAGDDAPTSRAVRFREGADSYAEPREMEHTGGTGNPWKHLYYGPSYDQYSKFSFDKWDSEEELSVQPEEAWEDVEPMQEERGHAQLIEDDTVEAPKDDEESEEVIDLIGESSDDEGKQPEAIDLMGGSSEDEDES